MTCGEVGSQGWKSVTPRLQAKVQSQQTAKGAEQSAPFLLIDLLRVVPQSARHADPGDHRLGDFLLSHDHDVGAQAAQMGDLFIGMSAGDDRQFGIERPRLGDDLAALERITIVEISGVLCSLQPFSAIIQAQAASRKGDQSPHQAISDGHDPG